MTLPLLRLYWPCEQDQGAELFLAEKVRNMLPLSTVVPLGIAQWGERLGPVCQWVSVNRLANPLRKYREVKAIV
jgi:hypothetical protein